MSPRGARRSPRVRTNRVRLMRMQRALARTIAQWFARERERLAADLVAAYSDQLAKADDLDQGYDWTRWTRALVNPTKRQLQRIYAQGAEESLATVGLTGAFGLKNPRAVNYARERAAEMVRLDGDKSIVDTTRAMLRQTIEKAISEGASPDELKRRLVEHHAMSRTRAEMIARSETAMAYNRGTIGGYRESGVVDEVLVVDGTDSDDECAEANGQIWTLEEADANPTAHPNCTREFRPRVRAA